MEDFIMLFNDLTTRCFDACVDDFKSNSLQRAEVREEKKSFDLLFFLFCLFFWFADRHLSFAVSSLVSAFVAAGMHQEVH